MHAGPIESTLKRGGVRILNLRSGVGEDDEVRDAGPVQQVGRGLQGVITAGQARRTESENWPLMPLPSRQTLLSPGADKDGKVVSTLSRAAQKAIT